MTEQKKLSWLNVPFNRYNSWDAPFDSDGYSYFALTDSLIETAGKSNQAMIHFWPTESLVFLGMIDTKLPYLNEALPVFADNGYDYVIRNSGGLAVVSDPGILNFSIIFPEGSKRLTINEAYQRMHDLVSASLEDLGLIVDAGEIITSYCPGDYDFSIDGKKIAGISQRRIKGGIAVMIYLSVSGDQEKRATMVKDFYDVGLKGEVSSHFYPSIDPPVMTTLQEASGQVISVEDMIQRLIQTIKTHQTYPSISDGKYTNDIIDQYQKGYEKMEKRNHKMLPDER